jgi:hypothetical protein
MRYGSAGMGCVVLLLISSAVSAAGVAKWPHARPLKVLTYNLYVGEDLDTITEDKNPQAFFLGIISSNPEERLKVVAEQIRRKRPHIIGLQEVALIRFQGTGDFFGLSETGELEVKNPLPNAEETLLDFLEILLAELNKRGPIYRAVAVQRNTDVELGVQGVDLDRNGASDDIRVTDRDVMLARWDVPVSSLSGGLFNRLQLLQIELGDTVLPVFVRRGFAIIKAWIGGEPVAVANMHLANKMNDPTVQASQAADVISELNTIGLPAVLLGDMNSGPADGDFSPYAQFAAAGFEDAWENRRNTYYPSDPDGFTCCQDKNLDNVNSEHDKRIDLVLYRNHAGAGTADSWRVRTHVIGDQPLDPPLQSVPTPIAPTPSPIYWASDHAGVSATIRRR